VKDISCTITLPLKTLATPDACFSALCHRQHGSQEIYALAPPLDSSTVTATSDGLPGSIADWGLVSSSRFRQFIASLRLHCALTVSPLSQFSVSRDRLHAGQLDWVAWPGGCPKPSTRCANSAAMRVLQERGMDAGCGGQFLWPRLERLEPLDWHRLGNKSVKALKSHARHRTIEAGVQVPTTVASPGTVLGRHEVIAITPPSPPDAAVGDTNTQPTHGMTSGKGPPASPGLRLPFAECPCGGRTKVVWSAGVVGCKARSRWGGGRLG